MWGNLRSSHTDSLYSRIASKQQLERLVKLTISIQPSTHLFVPELRASACFTQVLRSAHFWELPNLRRESIIALFCIKFDFERGLVAFLSSFDTQTSFLDEVDTTKYLAQKEPQSLPIPLQELQSAVLAYEILLFAPAEYLSRTFRADLVRRAVSADILSSLSIDVDHTVTNVSRSLTVIRVFIQRIILYTGSMDHLVRTFYLLQSPLKPHNLV
jgi:hypothetical protein